MKVNRIAANAYMKTAKNTQANQKNSNPLSFEGYKREEPFGSERMGYRPCLGWHSGVKRAVDLQIYKPWGERHYAYIADVHEHPDLNLLKADRIDFLVEYVKPDDIKLDDFMNGILNPRAEKPDFTHLIDYAWAEKDELQGEYNKMRGQLDSTYKGSPVYNNLVGKVKDSEVSLYYLGEKIDAYNELQELADNLAAGNGDCSEEEVISMLDRARSIYEQHFPDLCDNPETLED